MGEFLYEIVRNRANRYNFKRFCWKLSLVNPIDREQLGVRFPPAPPFRILPASLFATSSLPKFA